MGACQACRKERDVDSKSEVLGPEYEEELRREEILENDQRRVQRPSPVVDGQPYVDDPRSGILYPCRVRAFCYPGFEHPCDDLCEVPFLASFFECHLEIEVPRGSGMKYTFSNASAAFQALRFPHVADSFQNLSGDEAICAKMQHYGVADETYGGYGSKWAAMNAVLKAKFPADSHMAEALLHTDDDFLMEHCSEFGRDRVWSDNADGTGQNWLGLQLMVTRDELSGQCKSPKSWTSEFIATETGTARLSASSAWQAAVKQANEKLRRYIPALEPMSTFNDINPDSHTRVGGEDGHHQGLVQQQWMTIPDYQRGVLPEPGQVYDSRHSGIEQPWGASRDLASREANEQMVDDTADDYDEEGDESKNSRRLKEVAKLAANEQSPEMMTISDFPRGVLPEPGHVYDSRHYEIEEHWAASRDLASREADEQMVDDTAVEMEDDYDEDGHESKNSRRPKEVAKLAAVEQARFGASVEQEDDYDHDGSRVRQEIEATREAGLKLEMESGQFGSLATTEEQRHLSREEPGQFGSFAPSQEQGHPSQEAELGLTAQIDTEFKYLVNYSGLTVSVRPGSNCVEQRSKSNQKNQKWKMADGYLMNKEGMFLNMEGNTPEDGPAVIVEPHGRTRWHYDRRAKKITYEVRWGLTSRNRTASRGEDIVLGSGGQIWNFEVCEETMDADDRLPDVSPIVANIAHDDRVEWACRRCDYMNAGSYSVCADCAAPRPLEGEQTLPEVAVPQDAPSPLRQEVDTLLEEEGTVWGSLLRDVRAARGTSGDSESTLPASESGALRVVSQRSVTQPNGISTTKATTTSATSKATSSMRSASNEEGRKWQAGVLSVPSTAATSEAVPSSSVVGDVGSPLRVHSYHPSDISVASHETNGPSMELMIEERARKYASSVLNSMKEDLLPESVIALSEDVGKKHLSKERVQLILQKTESVRVTCEQLKKMVGMVTLDSHKKEIIIQRYAQVIDKDSFCDIVLDSFTRSSSLQKKLVKDLNENLCKELEVKGYVS